MSRLDFAGYAAKGEPIAVRAFELLSSNASTAHESLAIDGAEPGTIGIDVNWDNDTWRIVAGRYIGPFESGATIAVTWESSTGAPMKSVARISKAAPSRVPPGPGLQVVPDTRFEDQIDEWTTVFGDIVAGLPDLVEDGELLDARQATERAGRLLTMIMEAKRWRRISGFGAKVAQFPSFSEET